MQRRTTINPSQDTPEAAWAAGVRMLGRRELSIAQVRERLARRGWTETAIEPAIARLAASGALDEQGGKRQHQKAAAKSVQPSPVELPVQWISCAGFQKLISKNT